MLSSIVDWLGREGGALFSWWLLTALAGIAVFPLTFRLMRGLPGRGYALARTAGIILVAYPFWLLNVLGLLRNDAGNTALVAIGLLVLSIISYATWRDREPIIPWLRANYRLIIATELIFVAAFASWALIRALNPDVTGTEKPMEMGFLAATRRSLSFPPNDMWMSGYAISYYHFGYIMIAALANLSGVTNGMAFNLSAALLFALTCTGAFGIGYELVAARLAELPPEKRRLRWSPYAVGLLAMVMLALMGNLGPALIEVPYQTKALPDSYFQMMDVKERDIVGPTTCPQTGQIPPKCYWWWFAWSRVVRDRDIQNVPIEIIDEIPAFSWVLSDVHPHVLSLPFVLLALTLMLNLVLTKRGAHPWEFLIYVVCIGGLAFLNSWDASFIVLLVASEALRRLLRNGTGRLTREDFGGIAGFGGLVALLTGILYSPFFISFRSQAGGPLPSVIWATRPQQFFLFFGIFAVILAVYVAVEAWRGRGTFNTRLAREIILYSAGLLAFLLVATTLIAWISPDIRAAVFSIVDGSGGVLGVLPTVLGRRLLGAVTEGFLLALVFGVIGRLFVREPRNADGIPTRNLITYSPATAFVLMLIGAGAVLVLTPDFVYLRDVFSNRMNTVFKLYYQAWAVWSIASAYAVWSVLADPIAEALPQLRVSRGVRLAFSAAAVILIGAGMIYLPLAIDSRAIMDGGHANGTVTALTLDGGRTLASGADDYTVITCLSNLVKGDTAVVAEGMIEPVSYLAQYGRVSVLSGIPTIMGWSNHESQWRGSTYDAIHGTRVQDEAKLYNTLDLVEAQQIIKKYHVTYIYVGPTEHNLYDANGGLSKFDNLTPICRSGESAVYATDTLNAGTIAANTPPEQ